MSEHVTFTANFGDNGFRYSGLRKVEVSGDAPVAVEAMRALLTKAGLGVPRQVTVSARSCVAGPGGFDVTAIACDRAEACQVTAEEAARFGRELLERLGVKVRDAGVSP